MAFGGDVSEDSFLETPRTRARHMLFDDLSSQVSLSFSLREELGHLPYVLGDPRRVHELELDGNASDADSSAPYQAFARALEHAARPLSVSTASSLGPGWEPERVAVAGVRGGRDAREEAVAAAAEKASADPMLKAFAALLEASRGTSARAYATRAMALLSATPIGSDRAQARRVWQVLGRAVEGVAGGRGWEDWDGRSEISPVLTPYFVDDPVARKSKPAHNKEEARGTEGEALLHALRGRIFHIADLYEGKIARLEDELEAASQAFYKTKTSSSSSSQGPGSREEGESGDAGNVTGYVSEADYAAVEARYQTLGTLFRADLSGKEARIAALKIKLEKLDP